MKSSRLEAFSDGVLAIIITIMVLELRVPDESTWSALLERAPVFVSYVVSFIYIGIYWNNHHHLFQATERINGGILWANLHLLFWLSLIPFTTAWAGEDHTGTLPITAYGVVLLMCALAYLILQRKIIKAHGEDFILKAAIGSDRKGMVSVILYIIGIITSFINPWIAIGCYILVAILWFIPDQRIERNFG